MIVLWFKASAKPSSCTVTDINLYLSDSFATDFNERIPYSLLTFQVLSETGPQINMSSFPLFRKIIMK
jgi:hypothetical protein